MPSLPTLTFRDLRFLPIAATLTILAFSTRTDTDLWWHLRTGQLIVDGHRFITSDPFSWTAEGRHWYLHEWLSEVIIYWVQSTLGFAAIVAITAAVIVATMAVTYRLALSVCAREFVVLGLVALSVLMLPEFIRVRPQVFSWLFFAIFWRQLYLNYRGQSVPLWPLPLLMIFWSNMHLGYLFGIMSIYVWLFCTVIRDFRAGLASLRAPLVLTVMSTLAPVVSPIGPRALLVPFDYVANSSAAVANISEWASPNFHSPVFVPFAIALGVLVIIGLPLGRANLFGVSICLILLALSLLSIRNIPFVAVAFPVIASEAIARRWPTNAGAPRAGRSGLNWAIAATLVIATITALPFFGRQFASDPSVPASLPSEGVAYVREHPLGTRMLNSYNWGGFLIYELYPGVKVSMDGRSDLYGDKILNDYFDLTQLKLGWRDQLRQLDPDLIFLPKDSALASELRDDAAWMIAFEGSVELIFVPTKAAS